MVILLIPEFPEGSHGGSSNRCHSRCSGSPFHITQVVCQHLGFFFCDIGYKESRCRDVSCRIIQINDLVPLATNSIQHIGDSLRQEESNLLEPINSLLGEYVVSSVVAKTKTVHHGAEGCDSSHIVCL